ncbi:MAG: pyruvate kinase [Clostridiales bacterium]|nr:pyruvate kinase [Clostridiales bacterium]
MSLRKTKIVCTLGPSTDKTEILEEMVKVGMNVARLNFSHGIYDEQKKRLDEVKTVSRKLGIPVATLLDTKGPEIRLGCFKNKQVELMQGQIFRLTTNEIEGDEESVFVTYSGLPNDVSVGTTILIDDGLIELVVEKLTEKDISCKVLNGGFISDRKGVNVPNVKLNMDYISEKDKNDIIFGIENDFDFIAASFVRNVNDIFDVRRILEENGGEDIQIIAKIENYEGVSNIDDIVKASDGIMVARGDLGVEIDFEELPQIQKKLIESGYKAEKKVITATQMLESMIKNPRPTRAEVSDVANAVYDGTSAVMLSGETAAGKYPVESLRTMSKIVTEAEKDINYIKRFNENKLSVSSSISHAISHATCTTAHDLNVSAIIVVTKSGYTARAISSFRPASTIVSAVTSEKVCRQLALSWGVYPIMAKEQQSSEELYEHAVEKAIETNFIENGDLVVVTGSSTVGISGTTNTLKVHLVGNILLRGVGINNLSVYGKVLVAENKEQALEEFTDQDILVISKTSMDMEEFLKNFKGIVVEQNGASSHGAIVGITLGIPIIFGATDATKVLKTGMIVTIESGGGIVYSGIVKIGC